MVKFCLLLDHICEFRKITLIRVSECLIVAILAIMVLELEGSLEFKYFKSREIVLDIVHLSLVSIVLDIRLHYRCFILLLEQIEIINM